MESPGKSIFRRILIQRLLEFGFNRCPKFGRLQHFDMLALPQNVHGKFTYIVSGWAFHLEGVRIG